MGLAVRHPSLHFLTGHGPSILYITHVVQIIDFILLYTYLRQEGHMLRNIITRKWFVTPLGVIKYISLYPISPVGPRPLGSQYCYSLTQLC